MKKNKNKNTFSLRDDFIIIAGIRRISTEENRDAALADNTANSLSDTRMRTEKQYRLMSKPSLKNKFTRSFLLRRIIEKIIDFNIVGFKNPTL
ncbi:hypothetical protein V4V55_003980 [Vibrio mimicus]|nr:hypothetical protein [Vibrio mimicus]